MSIWPRFAMIVAWTIAAGAQTPVEDRAAAEYQAWRDSVDSLLPKLADADPRDAAAILNQVEARLVRQHDARRALQNGFLRSFARFSDTLPPASPGPSPQVPATEVQWMRQAALRVSGQAGLLVPSAGAGAAREQRIAAEETARARDRLAALADFLESGAALLERYGSAPALEAPPAPDAIFTPARLFNEVRSEMESDDRLLQLQRSTLQEMRKAFVPHNEEKVSRR